jgi:hypothetical protein
VIVSLRDCVVCGNQTPGLCGGVPVCFDCYDDGSLVTWLSSHPVRGVDPSSVWFCPGGSIRNPGSAS